MYIYIYTCLRVSRDFHQKSQVQLKDRVAPSGRSTESTAPSWLEFGFAGVSMTGLFVKV